MNATALGLAVGAALDRCCGDPRRRHPVAGFGTLASKLEERMWRDNRTAGAAYLALTVGTTTGAAWWAYRLARRRRWSELVFSAAVTWAALGQRSLIEAADAVSRPLLANEMAEARGALGALCAREADDLDADELAAATVESVAENTSDASIAPLWWGVVAGPVGIVAHRCVNTLDAMVGYRTRRYRRFGTAAARLDDVMNFVPARLTALAAIAFAPAVGGTSVEAARVVSRDSAAHPSPNAGTAEAAFAGALGVRIGGTVNTYGDTRDRRPRLGRGRRVRRHDIARANRLSWLIYTTAVATAVVARWRCRR
ncbi:adenosylcobinamide-phosphate synthase CbiB [Haloglycomyces albus]|uniref:adenosylcobinamide-phosphate synthase CbiB n=1 Tax=Haloglycomyces albus TaxID=526067 RepID=UPI00046C9A83|nr:adenosylcobinamide-phosphate synthase CbiB [Haloglycomyces albus]